MSLLFNHRVGGCCCPRPIPTPPHPWPFFRFLPGLIVAALLLSLGIFLIIRFSLFVPIVILILLLLLLIGLIIFA